MNIKIGYEKEKTQETAVLTLRAENDPHETVRHSCRTVGRLFRTAQFLPEGERLGWRFWFSPDGAFRCTAFASSGAQATCEDLAWIFRDSADTAPDDGVQPEEEEKSRCYRVLTELNGRVCIMESSAPISYDDFIQSVLDTGVRKALYLDMGAESSYSQYRNNQNRVVNLFGRFGIYFSGWIAFYK